MGEFDFDAVTERYFTPDQIRAIKRTTIGIAGAGGLGSNCAMILARSGFERFTVVDFDVVEASNLNRQQYFPDQIGRPKVECLRENLRRINSAITITTYQLILDNENIGRVFGGCDAVVEAVDKPECKALVVRELGASGKLVVCASGLAGFGEGDRIRTRKVNDHLYVIGDGHSGAGELLKPLAPCVTIAAAKQADVVLEWVLGGNSRSL